MENLRSFELRTFVESKPHKIRFCELSDEQYFKLTENSRHIYVKFTPTEAYRLDKGIESSRKDMSNDPYVYPALQSEVDKFYSKYSDSMKIKHNAKSNTFTISNISPKQLHQIYWGLHYYDTIDSKEMKEEIKQFLISLGVDEHIDKIILCK